MRTKTSALPAVAVGACALIALDVSAQDRRQITDTAACGIQQALLQSPGHYIIAIVEHLGRLDCDERSCTESLKIVKPFASRTPTGYRYRETSIVIEASRDSALMPRGYRSFVVAAPVPNSFLYYLPIVHGPIDSSDERVEEAVAKRSLGPPVGALCKKSLPANFRIQKAKD